MAIRMTFRLPTSLSWMSQNAFFGTLTNSHFNHYIDLKAISSEILVRTGVQVVCRQKPGLASLYQLEAWFLAGNCLNSYPDSGSHKKLPLVVCINFSKMFTKFLIEKIYTHTDQVICSRQNKSVFHV